MNIGIGIVVIFVIVIIVIIITSIYAQNIILKWPFYYHGLTLIPAWISNYTLYNVWDEITNPFPNYNGATVEF